MHRARVVVVGSSNIDLVVRTEHMPVPGQTVLGGDLLIASGGKGANQAVAAARLGAEVTLVARIGSDMFGDRALAEITASGVQTDYVIRDPDAPSGTALIVVDDSGQNSIVVAPGANARLRPEDVDAARPAFEEADVVVVQFETLLETVIHVLRLAKQMNKRAILNPAPARTLPEGFLRGVDVITPNEIEAAMLLGRPPDESSDPVEMAQALLGRGVGAAVVTLGRQGAVAVTPDRARQIAPFRVKAVDTTAAGDCFTGALACALGEGMGLEAAARFASAAAALSVTRPGAQSSMPHRGEVERFMANG